MSSCNCCFLTCIHISQEAGKVFWYFHILKNFLQFIVIHTVKGFDIVNKVEIDVFLELSCFFNDPADVGNLVSGSSAFSKNAVLGCNLKNDRMISVRFQGKPFNVTVIQVYAPTSNAEEAEVEQFYENLQDLLEVTPKKDVLFITGDWNAKVGSQETLATRGP